MNVLKGADPKRLKKLIPVVVLVVLFFAAPWIASVIIDLAWFENLGFREVFTTILTTKIMLGLAVGAIVGGLVYLNLRFARQLSEGYGGIVIQDPNAGPRQIDIGPVLKYGIVPAAIAAGGFVALSASAYWNEWLKWTHATDFGAVDPILGYEISFYVFKLPALDAIGELLVSVVGFCIFSAAAIYVVRGAVKFTPKGLSVEKPARVHLSALIAAMLLVLGFQAWLAMPNLMYSTVGPFSGASYSDVNAKLPALWGQVAAAVIGAVLVGVSATRSRWVLLLAGVGLYLVVDLAAVRGYPSMVHRFSVTPNEAVKEAPFIAHNIQATRAAFRIDAVAERELTGEETLTMEDINNNRATIENIRLWDHGPLLDTFAQLQEIRTYYDFMSVDNDRYMIDGQLRQTMLSPRELNPASLPNRTWINERFTYTHGYGVTLGPVNTKTPEGLPQLFIQDLPPVASIASLDVTRPEIYFGEKTSDYVFVRTANPEFDYPAEEDVYATYEGRAGIPLDSMVRLAAASIYLGSFKLLLSDDINDESRLLLHRNVTERVGRVAPFLALDNDPYMVVTEAGRLVWIQDAYTVSDHYPYSQPQDGHNYIRNAVKATVDAYDGTVTLYIADDADPVLQTYRSIFPDLFTPMSEMPEDIRAHVRYPAYIFSIQTALFALYHMDRPDLFYNREDQWEVPTLRRDDRSVAMEPYYTIMRLPGEAHAEFIQMLPFTPKRKQNLAAWMVARSDGDNLGELVAYKFPKDRVVFGPQQIMNRIDQNEDISRQLSLWDQRGSEVMVGTLLVIPIEESLIYVVPMYLKASGGRIPELKRVIVVYESQIAMEETLDIALEALFGGEITDVATVENVPSDGADGEPVDPTQPAEPPSPLLTVPVETAAQAQYFYEQAVERQRAGDWAGYGESLSRLGEILRTMQVEAPEAAAPVEEIPEAPAQGE